MVLKILMQHEDAAELQNRKLSLVENQKWPLLLKVAKPLKATFSQEPLDIFG